VTSREDDGAVSAGARPAPPVDALRTMLSQLSLQVLASTMVERVGRDGQVRGTAALWVVGVGADGYRASDEHAGLVLGRRYIPAFPMATAEETHMPAA
jgi:hypothetical protein